MFDILLHHNTLVLFGIIFFGIALGSIKIYGLNLGLSGVLFVALAAGHYRLAIPDGVGQLGLALFVYCVGLSAGNRFFSAIAKQGSKLAIMSAVIVGVSALFTCLFGIWFKVPAGISSGIFAGAYPIPALPARAAPSRKRKNALSNTRERNRPFPGNSSASLSRASIPAANAVRLCSGRKTNSMPDAAGPVLMIPCRTPSQASMRAAGGARKSPAPAAEAIWDTFSMENA